MKMVATWLLIIWAAERLRASMLAEKTVIAPNCETPGLPYGVGVPSWVLRHSYLPVVENR